MDVRESERNSGAHGMSLVGLLMVVVVLGALAATAIVGVGTLTGGSGIPSVSPGSSKSPSSSAPGGRKSPTSRGNGSFSGSSANACKAAADAAAAASTVYFVNSGGRSYPTKWSDMTASTPPVYNLATNVVINRGNPTELDGNGWKLIVSGGGTTAPTFKCS